ncbi:regulator of chromosome condensation 1/beta-lactamase-inhibitor protein II, partial [Baffinella frigidus]
KCWGLNSGGQLGLGDTTDRGDTVSNMGTALSFVDIGVDNTIISTATSKFHTCAVFGNNKVKCWGENSCYELGYGDTTKRGNTAGTMGDTLPINFGTSRYATKLTCGMDSACVILDNGDIKCWGSNRLKGLGHDDLVYHQGYNPDHMGDNLNVVPISGLDGVGDTTPVSVHSGAGHHCALLRDGAVVCWGSNGVGQLGIGSTVPEGVSQRSLVDLGTDRTAKQLTCGYDHTCVLLDDDNVKCWGGNIEGQLGVEDWDPRGVSENQMGDNPPFVSLSSTSKTLAVYGSMHRTCALLDDYTLRCWGGSSYGSMGIGTNTDNDWAYVGDEAGEMGDALVAVML